MGCCAGATGDKTALSDRHVVPEEVLAIASVSLPERVSFESTRSHTGTRNPVLPQDGEGIVRQHRLSAFAVDSTPVTNALFAGFVAETGHVTVAENFGWGMVFRGLLDDPDSVPPGGGSTPWWGVVDGACWHSPEGPGHTVADRADHPVTHIAWDDARAFAKWAGGRLPSEAEWEHAARGGLEDPRFVWGDREPDDTDFLPCNIFQGKFPESNTQADGWAGTSPVRAFAPNGAGLYDMAGNVWEWTAEPFFVRSLGRHAVARNEYSRKAGEKLMKGGSFLCHVSYCYRYRIAARLAMVADSGGCNSGFRVFYDA